MCRPAGRTSKPKSPQQTNDVRAATARTRADAAATVLRWLIGDDDRVPIRGQNPGELVDGFGDVVRSREQIAAVLALATQGQQRAVSESRDLNADPDNRRLAQQHAEYLNGVAATLMWVLGERPEAPITHAHSQEVTTKGLKRERIHAQDVIEQASIPWMADRLSAPWYGEGVKYTISWLLGDWIAQPVDSAGRGPYAPNSNVHAVLHHARNKQQ
jgi:hypothetical protein